jgi:hypothetical protein
VLVEGEQVVDDELFIAQDDCAAAGPALLERLGVFAVSSAVSPAALVDLQQAATARLEEVLKYRSQHYAAGTMGNGVWKELCCRDGDRFDVHYRMSEAPFAALGTEGSWCAAVRAVLGADAKLLYTGQVVACGRDAIDADDEADQEWHMDGGHLDEERYLPCHCLTVFVPLVDLCADNGATEFSLGSHLHECEDLGERVLECLAGSAIVFDYRTLHRGTANRTTADRPILYFTYARSWFEDPVNYRHANQHRSILAGCEALALAATVGDGCAAPNDRAAAATELRVLALASAEVAPLVLSCAGPLVALLSDERAGAEARGAAAGALQVLAVDGAAERAIVAAGAVAPLVALCADAAASGTVRARAARGLQNLAGPALAGEAHLAAAAVEAVRALTRCDDDQAAQAGATALAALQGGGEPAPQHVLPAEWERSVEFTQRLLSPADLSKAMRAVTRALYSPRPTVGVEIRLLEAGPCRGCRGLFASRPFVPGERIVRYCGLAQPRGAGCGPSDYLYALSGVAVDIDATRAGNESRYANDCRGTGRARNAQFVEAWGDADGRPAVEGAAAPLSLSLAVWIEALRPIAAGDEILVSYGAHYPLPGDATDDAANAVAGARSC